MKLTVREIVKDYLKNMEVISECRRLAMVKTQEIVEKHLGETLRFTPVRMYSGIVYDYIRILPDGYYAWGCETKTHHSVADQSLYETFGAEESDIKEAIILEDWEAGINRRIKE